MSKYRLDDEPFSLLLQLLRRSQYDVFFRVASEAGLTCFDIMELCESNKDFDAECDDELWTVLIRSLFARDPTRLLPGETVKKMHARLCASQEQRRQLEANFTNLARVYERYMERYSHESGPLYRLVGATYGQRLRALRREMEHMIATMRTLDLQSSIFARFARTPPMPPELLRVPPREGPRQRRTSTDERRR